MGKSSNIISFGDARRQIEAKKKPQGVSSTALSSSEASARVGKMYADKIRGMAGEHRSAPKPLEQEERSFQVLDGVEHIEVAQSLHVLTNNLQQHFKENFKEVTESNQKVGLPGAVEEYQKNREVHDAYFDLVHLESRRTLHVQDFLRTMGNGRLISLEQDWKENLGEREAVEKKDKLVREIISEFMTWFAKPLTSGKKIVRWMSSYGVNGQVIRDWFEEYESAYRTKEIEILQRIIMHGSLKDIFDVVERLAGEEPMDIDEVADMVVISAMRLDPAFCREDEDSRGYLARLDYLGSRQEYQEKYDRLRRICFLEVSDGILDLSDSELALLSGVKAIYDPTVGQLYG